MPNPTERHMAEARELLMQLDRYVAVPGTEQAGDDTRLVAAALAQAERRGAEAQREADKMTISGLSLTPYGALRLQGNAKGWGKAIEAIVKAVDAAPLATATPEPEPPASRAARESAQPLALATKLRPDGSPDCGR